MRIPMGLRAARSEEREKGCGRKRCNVQTAPLTLFSLAIPSLWRSADLLSRGLFPPALSFRFWAQARIGKGTVKLTDFLEGTLIDMRAKSLMFRAG